MAKKVNKNFETIADKAGAEWNPRIHKKQSATGLQESIERFGDLSGVVYNIRSGALIGGHFRKKVIDPKSIIKKKKVSDSVGTVAEGSILLPGGQRLNYREVDWDEITERAANVTANNTKIQGEFDPDMLKPILIDLKQSEMDIDALNLDELANELGIVLDEEEVKGIKSDVKALEKAIQLRPPREYVLIMCSDEEGSEEFEELKVLLNLKPVRRGGYREGSPFDEVGTQRVIDAEYLIERLKNE